MTDPLVPLAAPADVLAVPGVSAVFPARVAARLRDTVATAVGTDAEPVNRVEVTTSSGITRMRARIAASSRTPAGATGRAVADALLASSPGPDVAVTVQIALID